MTNSMSAQDRTKLHEKTGFLDPNTMAEEEKIEGATISEKDIFLQTLPNMVEENLMFSVEELSSYHHHSPQHLPLNMNNNWDSTIHELQGVNNNNNHHEHQQFQLLEEQNCSEISYNSPELLHLLQHPTANPSSSNFEHSMVFPGDNNNNNSASSSVLYDPLHNPVLGELYQSLPHGFLFGGVGDDGMEQVGDGCFQHDIGVTDSVIVKGREGKGTKQLPIDKQRREQLNGKYQILRSLVPNPTKVDRASVVGDAIEYIRELVRTVNELKLLVEKKRYERERCKRQRTEDETAASCNMRPLGETDGCIRTSWLQRKSKDSEVDVRIIDDEVTVKTIQRKKINGLLFASKVLDELQLDLHHIAGGHVGEYCSFLFSSKIIEGSSVYASAIANRVIEVMDTHYAASVPVSNTSSY